MSKTDWVPRLGVNIDHIATLRQLRGTPYPNLIEAAGLVEDAGADQITVHLREDRRHIQDQDITLLRESLKVPMNLEMAHSREILKIALSVRPAWACLVPEKRQEVTTEGGLDLKKNQKKLGETIGQLKGADIHVSLFVEPSLMAVRLSSELGADAVEFHTGRFCLAQQKGDLDRAQRELERIRKACELSIELGMWRTRQASIDCFDQRFYRPVFVFGVVTRDWHGYCFVDRTTNGGADLYFYQE